MIPITQYKAAKISGVSKQTINMWSNAKPRPGYFVDIPGKKAPMVDPDHPEFKAYCDKIRSDRLLDIMIKERDAGTGPSDEDIMKIFDAVEKVISDRYYDDEAGIVKGLIIEELEG